MDVVGNVAKTIIKTQGDEIKEAVSSKTADYLNKTSKEEATVLGDKIADYTCNLLNEKVPTIISNITENVISQLKDKINSDKFTTDFINVLQHKILENKEYSEIFFNKFDNMFDNILAEAKKRHDLKHDNKEIQGGYLTKRKTIKGKRRTKKRVRFLRE